MISKCNFQECADINKYSTDNINDLRVLLLGANNRHKSLLINNFLLENEIINEINLKDTKNEIFTFIKESNLTLLNHNLNLHIKFVLDKKDYYDNVDFSMHDVILLIFDINSQSELNYIKDIYEKNKLDDKNLIFFIGINKSKNCWSLYNFFKNDFITFQSSKLRHYYYEINIDKLQANKIFTILLEKFILSIINDININNNNYPNLLQSVIKYEISKRKYLNQIQNLNSSIYNLGNIQKNLQKQNGELLFKNTFLEQQNSKLNSELEKLKSVEKNYVEIIQDLQKNVQSLRELKTVAENLNSINIKNSNIINDYSLENEILKKQIEKLTNDLNNKDNFINKIDQIDDSLSDKNSFTEQSNNSIMEITSDSLSIEENSPESKLSSSLSNSLLNSLKTDYF